MSAYALQPWHITIGDELVLEEGSGRLDLARGYYDPNTQEVVITLQGWDADDPPDRALCPTHCRSVHLRAVAHGGRGCEPSSFMRHSG
jgi:hypothetical protein